MAFDREITVAEAQARGLHLVCTTPGQVSVGDIIEHTATGKQLRIVEIVNERQALAKLLGRQRQRPAALVIATWDARTLN